MANLRKEPTLCTKILGALLCKGDLSDNEQTEEPCSIPELFRFASNRDTVFLTIGLLLSLITGLLMPGICIFSGLVANIYLKAGGEVASNLDVFHAVTLFIVLYAVFAVIQFFLSLIMQHCLLVATSRIISRLRREFLSAVMQQDAAWLDQNSAGMLSSRLNESIDRIQDGLGEKICMVVRGCGMYTSSIIVAFFFNWKVSIVLFTVGPICTVIMGLNGFFSSGPFKQQMLYNARANAVMEESILNVKTVQACNGQNEMCKRFIKWMTLASRPAIRICFNNGFFEGLFFFVFYCITTAGFLWGVIDSHSPGGFEPGSVIVSANAILMGAYFMGILGPHMMALLKARIAAASIYKIIDRKLLYEKSCNFQRAEASAERLKGDISFHAVHFKYATRDTQILNGLSWWATPGTSIALVGHSGCGKSTSVGLLTRHYRSTGGSILVDGRDIETIDPRTLRQNIGIVMQEPSLFNCTIRENILLGRKWLGNGSDEERIRQVLHIAHADIFVDKLHEGLDTLIGDGGVCLSGGQKQRIAIARALFADPPILILDEATSALDVESERLVQKALNEASQGRTTITIAHRLSTLKEVDRIYVLEKGVVMQTGNHEELLREDGLYAQLARTQSVSGSSEGEKRREENENEEDMILAQLNRTIPARKSVSSLKSIQTIDVEFEIDGKGNKIAVRRSTFFRIYTHGHTCMILLTIFLSILRGWEIPLYTVIFRFLYGALNAPDASYTPELVRLCSLALGNGVFIWLTLTLACTVAGFSSERVMTRVKSRIIDKVLHQDAAYFDQPETSNSTIVTDINKHAANLVAGLDGRLVLFVYCVSSFIACTVISIVCNWKLGLIGLGFSLVLIILICFMFFLMTNETERLSLQDRTGELAIEILEQTRTIQLMVAEEYFSRCYENTQEGLFSTTRKIAFLQSLIYALSQGGVYLFGFLGLLAGSHYVYAGEIASDDMFTILFSFEFCGWVISFIYPTFPDLIKANAAARILYRYYDLSKPVDDDTSSTPQLSGGFVADRINFTYPNRPGHKVARKLCVSARAGESIALVGPSGCGKSTLIGLLERFYTQQSGTIRMDGIDIKQMSMHHMRKQVALVGQEPVLFEGTIAENVLLGTEGRSMSDVIDACRMANAANFINGLPLGYDSEVGEKGRALSGGQKQRIAIARALIRKPKLLLLDEATSALDAESEKVVQEALASASQGRTSISIAHRLASIKDVNRIYFIQDGSVVESGTHQELINLNGKYAQYVKSQTLES